ncbi:MAG: hypothetical protein RI885_2254 [Actinomycetota bacterium]|jgi:hypothetical protein
MKRFFIPLAVLTPLAVAVAFAFAQPDTSAWPGFSHADSAHLVAILPDSETLAKAPMPIDTTAAAAFVAKQATHWLDKFLPSLSPDMSAKIVTGLSVASVALMMQLWKLLIGLLQKPQSVARVIGPFYGRYKKLINPLIVLLVGWVVGGSLLTGMVAAFVKVYFVNAKSVWKEISDERSAKAAATP